VPCSAPTLEPANSPLCERGNIYHDLIIGSGAPDQVWHLNRIPGNPDPSHSPSTAVAVQQFSSRRSQKNQLSVITIASSVMRTCLRGHGTALPCEAAVAVSACQRISISPSCDGDNDSSYRELATKIHFPSDI